MARVPNIEADRPYAKDDYEVCGSWQAGEQASRRAGRCSGRQACKYLVYVSIMCRMGVSLVINTPSGDSVMRVVLKLTSDLGCDHL